MNCNISYLSDYFADFLYFQNKESGPLVLKFSIPESSTVNQGYYIITIKYVIQKNSFKT